MRHVTELVGRGSVQKLPEILFEMEAKSIFLVTGKSSYQISGAESILNKLLFNYTTHMYNEFSANPNLQEVLQGVNRCCQVKPDVIVAIGGGSAIDMAKAVAAFYEVANADIAYNNMSNDAELEGVVPNSSIAMLKGQKEFTAQLLPIIAIPTTAGTGSEATHFAVIYYAGEKYSLASPALLPKMAVLDASFTDQLPPYITASTGFDALCQAVESHWSIASSQRSREFSKKAIETILEWLPKAVKQGDRKSREKMLIAANYAGKAINLTKTTAPHALSYRITSLFGIAHGHAVAMTLGAFFPFHFSQYGVINGERSWRAFNELQKELYGLLGVNSPQGAKRCWYDLMKECGLGTRVKGHPLYTSPKMEKLISGVNLQRLNNHPVRFNPERLAQILASVPDL